MKLRQLLYLTVVSAAFVAAASTAQAAFPPIGLDSGPGLTLTLGTGGTVTIATTGQGPFDGSEDTYVGVINNSGASVSSLHLSSTNTSIFGFDGDGIDTASPGVPGNGSDNTGYGGPNAFFTNIAANLQSGDVHFIVPIPNGGTDFFSLEEPLDTATFGNGGGVTIGGGVPEPSIWAVLLIGFAGLGYVTRRKSKVRGALA